MFRLPRSEDVRVHELGYVSGFQVPLPNMFHNRQTPGAFDSSDVRTGTVISSPSPNYIDLRLYKSLEYYPANGLRPEIFVETLHYENAFGMLHAFKSRVIERQNTASHLTNLSNLSFIHGELNSKSEFYVRDPIEMVIEDQVDKANQFGSFGPIDIFADHLRTTPAYRQYGYSELTTHNVQANANSLVDYLSRSLLFDNNRKETQNNLNRLAQPDVFQLTPGLYLPSGGVSMGSICSFMATPLIDVSIPAPLYSEWGGFTEYSPVELQSAAHILSRLDVTDFHAIVDVSGTWPNAGDVKFEYAYNRSEAVAPSSLWLEGAVRDIAWAVCRRVTDWETEYGRADYLSDLNEHSVVSIVKTFNDEAKISVGQGVDMFPTYSVYIDLAALELCNVGAVFSG